MTLPKVPWRRPRLGAVTAIMAFLAASCAEDKPQDVLNPAGPFARQPDRLWDMTFAIAVAIFLVVEGLLVFALIRFRHRPGRKAAQFHGNTRLEVVWTLIPALILAVVGVQTVRQIFALADKPSGALPVTIVAHQFWWEFRYPTLGFTTANELHIPTGRPIYVTTRGESTEPVSGYPEVVHSFRVPRLTGATDIIPGHEANFPMQANEPGLYIGQCVEFCGLGHALMRLRVYAQTPAEFNAWVARQKAPAAEPPPGSLAAQGATLFARGSENNQFPGGPACAACHALDSSLDAQPTTGPNLAHFASRATFASDFLKRNPQNLSAWINDPPNLKEGAKMPKLGLTESQIRAVVAYLQTLK